MTSPTLQDIQRVPREAWVELGRRMRAAAITTAFPRLWAMRQSFEPACRAPRVHELRKHATDAARLLRLFWVQDDVPRADAESALGASLLETLLASNILRGSEGGTVSSTMKLDANEETIVLAEDLARGGDAVMGIGPLTTLLVKVTRPERELGSLLDLGCGAGFVAASLAGGFSNVVATDINDRAVALAMVNGALAGKENIEPHVGDLYAPVAGRRFDRIASQPPFIATPSAGTGPVYSAGGRRGDELPLRALAGAAAHLTERGRGLFIINWLDFEGETVQDRVRSAVGPEANVLVVDMGELDLDAITIGNAMFDDPTLGARYEEVVVRKFDHLSELAARGLKVTLVVVTPAPNGQGWTNTFEMSDSGTAELTLRDVDAWLATFDVLSSSQERLLDAKLTLRPGAQLAKLGDGSATVVSPRDSPITQLTIGPGTLPVLERILKAKTGAEAAKRYAKDARVTAAVAARTMAQVIEAFLRKGLLEIDR